MRSNNTQTYYFGKNNAKMDMPRTEKHDFEYQLEQL